ncbi:MAG: hypothetical protein NTY53_26645 [Kiritimatiellaeota bacterium]|nr:hypothetical protein [Kiritimatiellota bacterium]
MLGSELTIAQTTNGIPIVHRTHRYSSRVQLLGGQAPEVPAPPPSDDDPLVPGQNSDKVQDNVRTKGGMLTAPLPTRRPDLRKDKHKDDDSIKSLFVIDPSTTNKADPEIKKWGWLAEETDVSRQRLASYKKPNTDDEGWTNSLTGNTRTNATKRMEIGSLKANSFEPLGTTHTSTANVIRVVEDRVARDAEKRKQDETQTKMAQKEGLHLADKSDGPARLTTTNETMGLTRSRNPQSDGGLDADFSQTRKTLSEITGRYQLGLTMADIIRQPAKPPTDITTARADTMYVAQDNDGAPGHYGEIRRPTPVGDSASTMTTAAKPPMPLSGAGPTWMKQLSGMAPQGISASTMVEGPKMPKATDISGANRQPQPQQQPISTPVATPAMPAYTPGSITPSFTPGGSYTPGSLTPSFKPTTPYKNLFDTTPSR